MDTISENHEADMTISIHPKNMSKTNNGRFEGWGTSLCWWANRVGYSDRLVQQAVDLFFGDGGLRLNIMRYNIGGGDDPSHTHITRTDSAIPGWLKYDEAKQCYVFDDTADFNQLNVLKRAFKAAGATACVEVFSTSPPYFMTISGCSSGHWDAKKDNLKEDSYPAFADYLAQVTKYINDELGIPIFSVSPMNEPSTDYWVAYSPKQEGCHFDQGASQSRLLVETAAAFQKYGLSEVQIAAGDETSTQTQAEAYYAYSAEAKKIIGKLNTHTYDTNGIDTLGRLAAKEHQNLWMSEVDGDGTAGENAGEMGSALWLAKKIISDVNALSPSAWVLWQVIGYYISSEGYRGNQDPGMVDINRGFWGLAVSDHDKENIILTQKYYGFGQFTRYIRPGATLIHCGDDALAAYDGEKGELVIVALNLSGDKKRCCFSFSNMGFVGNSVKAVRTSGGIENGEHWAQLGEIPARGNGFTAELKANSITTFLVEGVQFDNHDSRIKYFELLLSRDLDSLPYFPLPEGYRFVFYRPGDRDHWIEIEQSAKEFESYEEGLRAWERYYAGKEDLLSNRMVFIENANGEKVATATAFYDIHHRDQSGDGWLHWVAVRREYQGKGLSKPLISYVLGIMRELGYTHAKIPTQTTTWLACKVYLDFGFLSLAKNAIHSRDGWRIIKALTNHPALYSFDCATIDEILAK